MYSFDDKPLNFEKLCKRWKYAFNVYLPFPQISEQIHEQRRCQMPREPGVGAELTSPNAGEAHQYNNSDSQFVQPADLSQDEKVCQPSYEVMKMCAYKCTHIMKYFSFDKNNVLILLTGFKFTKLAIWS